MDNSSIDFLFGSGKNNSVITNAIVENMASTIISVDKPLTIINASTNVPINAPVLPPAADIPVPRPLAVTGNTSGG